MNTRIKVKHRWHDVFLRERIKGYPVNVAASRAGVGMEKLINERNFDPEFAARWADAEDKKKQAVSW